MKWHKEEKYAEVRNKNMKKKYKQNGGEFDKKHVAISQGIKINWKWWNLIKNWKTNRKKKVDENRSEKNLRKKTRWKVNQEQERQTEERWLSERMKKANFKRKPCLCKQKRIKGVFVHDLNDLSIVRWWDKGPFRTGSCSLCLTGKNKKKLILLLTSYADKMSTSS